MANSGWLEQYQSLGVLERVGGQFVLTVVVAIVVLGMIHRHGTDAVTKARRSPIISLCIGTPTLLVISGLTAAGYYMLGSSVGTFFGVVLIAIGFAALPTSIAIGFVAIGQGITGRLGRTKLWHGILMGGLLAGLSGVSLSATLVAVTITGTLGTGALVRILFGAGGTTSPEERTVPPANKI
ncbi:hypothetical protein D8Y22_14030 [Salinadaptatus halalkaliphilus]|uniref:Uncharacterized protein n=1 Tax=Salinadaptatus halalkaliphilus TaxID=2419781 RepID=A0A4V3VL45_9EURY|nr:hypothetical protein D8Y22_14030 [Salinadaptatus halalkaliphilus]